MARQSVWGVALAAGVLTSTAVEAHTTGQVQSAADADLAQTPCSEPCDDTDDPCPDCYCSCCGLRHLTLVSPPARCGLVGTVHIALPEPAQAHFTELQRRIFRPPRHA